jgi:Membrane bound O-acyl transferase family
MYLSAYCEGLIAGTMLLTGLKCETVMENPLMQSSSLTELWGKKWNKLVEGVLKRGVYIPLRKSGLSKIPASFGTFLASGLFHEWLLAGE